MLRGATQNFYLGSETRPSMSQRNSGYERLRNDCFTSRESAKLVSGTLAVSTTTPQSRVGTRHGRASGAGSPASPRAGATLDGDFDSRGSFWTEANLSTDLEASCERFATCCQPHGNQEAREGLRPISKRSASAFTLATARSRTSASCGLCDPHAAN